MSRTATTLLLAATLMPLSAAADGPLFMKDRVPEGTEFPSTFGVGINAVIIDQDYVIDSLSFSAPTLPPGTTVTGVNIDNKTDSMTLKFDAWVLPFLNLHVMYGDIHGRTDVGFQNNSLGLPLSPLRIPLDGSTTGIGGTFVYGTDSWFTSVSATWNETDLDSSALGTSDISSLAVNPKFGINFTGGNIWVGGLYLDIDEQHTGTFSLPLVGPTDYDITLKQSDSFSYTAGARINVHHDTWANLEFAFGGGREYALLNFEIRF